MNDML
jgi:hypothetical protein